MSWALTEVKLLTLISRSDTFSFSGEKSKFSELILESTVAQSLMTSRNAKIKLSGKCLVFSGGIRKKTI
ncbi:hypothetical protein AAFN75_06070 [Algibacter sp. AS12]|uniref:hypothetical protein n=1 Tax=Algibacter sp. AS12 TaxID=3135773 RepID=UPI00398B7B6C